MDRTLDATESDLMVSLEAMLAPTGGGLRTVEIAQRLDVSPSTVRKYLRELHDQGRLERVRKHIKDLAGRRTHVAAYKLRAEDEEKDD